MTGSGSYPFDFDFQLSLIALAFREPKFSIDYNFLLEPTYFDNEDLRHLARILADFCGRHGKTPDPSIFHDLVRSYSISKRMEEAVCQRIEFALDRALTHELTDIEWIREEAVRFAKGQLMKSAILNAYNNLANFDDYGKIVDTFQKILEVDMPTDRVLQFAQIASEIPTQFRGDSSNSIQTRVPTGLPSLDDHMFGGSARGKLGVIMAASGFGKTHFLTFLGSQAIRRGYAVFHIALGDMNAWEVSLRYAANFTSIDSYDIIRGVNSDYQAAILRWLQAANKDLFISAHPPDTVSTGNLKSIISSLISKSGVKPALIIVDYADNLFLGSTRNPEASHTNSLLGTAYKQLIKIAAQFDAALWTGSQVQRSFYRLSSKVSGEMQGARYVPGIIDTDAIAEAIKKIDQAEYIISLNQSKEEREAGIARLFEAKIRFGKDKHVIDVAFDKGTSMFLEQAVHNADEDAREAVRSTPSSPVMKLPKDPNREMLAKVIDSPFVPAYPKLVKE